MKLSVESVKTGAKRLAVGSVILASAAACLAMLIVMLCLSARVASAAFPIPGASAPASPPAVSAVPSRPAATPAMAHDAIIATDPSGAGPQQSIAKPDDGVNSSVANAMTAVGTAVAAVTLILSLGTTWFALKLKDVDDATRKLKKTKQEYDESLAAMREQVRLAGDEYDRRMSVLSETVKRRDDARLLLTGARFAIRQWVDENSLSSSRYSLLADMNTHLELLLSPLPEQRRNSFGELIRFLPDQPGHALQALECYCQHCHELHGGTENSHSLWCSVFNPIERLAHVQSQRKEPHIY